MFKKQRGKVFNNRCNHSGMWREISTEILIGGSQKTAFKCIGCGLLTNRTTEIIKKVIPTGIHPLVLF